MSGIWRSRCDNDAADNCGAGDSDGHYCGTAAACQHTRGVEGPQGGDREVDGASTYVRSLAAKKKCLTMCHIPCARWNEHELRRAARAE